MPAGDEAAARAARREVLRTVWQALWAYRRRTAAALALLLAAKLLMVAVPAVLKRIVDLLSEPQSLAALPVFLLMGYALLRFAGSLFTELRDMVFVRVTQAAVAGFTQRLFGHLHQLGARFHALRQTGALARDMERGTAGLGFLLGTGLFTLLPTLVEIVAVLVILVLGYSAWYACIVALTFAAYAACTVALTGRRLAYQRRLNEIDSAANGRMVDSLLNQEAVKLYANEALESRRLAGLLDRWQEVGVANQYSLSALHVGQSAIIAAGVAAVMLLAGQQVTGGQATVGDLVLINAYIIQICLPLNTLGMIFRQAREAMVNAERVTALLRHRPEAADDDRLAELKVERGAVRFESVGFAYEPGRQILWDVDLDLLPGQTVAIVGGSGSGKSTLARLLLRFYDADTGRITVDGQDVRGLRPASVRRAIGIVPQDTVLFNDTIHYNIAYGRPGAVREDVIAACKGARIHDFILGLPEGYDTLVGERGLRLSGGERQRIAIARAILKNPPIMLFDEATSALDSRTEQAIQAELERIAVGRTTLVIAHRLSTVVGADQIVVLEHGRVVERGSHDALLRAGGLYAQMWALQRQQGELEAAGGRLARQPVNLAATAAGVVDALRPAMEERGIGLYSSLAEEARVTGDPGALQELAWRLCAHAVAAAPAGGRVELSVERAGAVARLAVAHGGQAVGAAPASALLPADAGMPGKAGLAGGAAVGDAGGADLPPDLPERLLGALAFDPGQAAALAEREGGVLHVEPQADGGWRCVAEFPLRAVAPAVPSARPAPAGPPQLAGLRVAVVDDQAEARELVGEALAGYGAGVQGYGSGQALLDALRAGRSEDWPQVLVCDLALGDMEGYEVIARVRRIEQERGTALAARLPAVALSGYARPEDRLRALLAGFQVHLPKPADPAELAATVAAVALPGAAAAGPRQ